MTDQPDERIGKDPETGRFLPGHTITSPYQPEYVEQARKLAQLGATDAQIGDFFGVSVRTIHRWKLSYAEFGAALKVGKEQPDDNVERSYYQSAIGYEVVEQQAIKIKIQEKTGTFREEVVVVDVVRHVPADTGAAFRWLINRRKDEWRDKVSHEHTGRDGEPIRTITTEMTAKEAAELYRSELG